MNESPIDKLLRAVDDLDVDAVMSLFAPDVRLLAVDGRRAEGSEAVRALIANIFGSLRSTTHRITAQWQTDDVCIAEVEADYVLKDWLRLNALPRAFVLYGGPDGVVTMNVYGAHERPLTDHRTGEEGMWIGGRWVPPL